MFENCEISPPPLSRKTRQQRYLFANNSVETTSSLLQSRFCISRIINTTKKSFKGQIISITFVFLAVVALFPKASLSSPISSPDEDSASILGREAYLYPTNHVSGLSDFEGPSNLENNRMKRDANYEDEDAMEDFNSWLGDGNAMEIGKRSGNNRARRVSMMRLKKDLMQLYPKRMSMMRLRRQFFPVRDYQRATRGMGKVSMLRLKKGSPSYMRLKKMTQMRLKKMTQMRLKKSGDNYNDEAENMASENKRDQEETAPVVLATDEEGMY